MPCKMNRIEADGSVASYHGQGTVISIVGRLERRVPHPNLGCYLFVVSMFAAAGPPALVAQECTDPPEGMVAWWDGCGAYDLLDEHHGSWVGYPICEEEWKVGGECLSFFPDPPTYIVVPNDSDLNFGTEELTIDAWIKTRSGADISGWGPIVHKGPVSSGYAFGLVDGKLAFDVCDGACVRAETSGTVNDGTWHHVAAVLSRDGGSGDLIAYIDGIERARESSPLGNIDSPHDLLIGAGPSLGMPTHVFDGFVDELEIFNRALSPEEIQAIFDADYAGKCKCVDPPADMLAWWPLDEDAGPTAYDIVAGNDGKYVNAPMPTSGKVAGALSFDGIDDYVEVPHFNAVNPYRRWQSIDAWIMTVADGTRSIVYQQLYGNFGAYGNYELELQNGQLSFRVCASGVCDNVRTEEVVNDGTWHHVAGVLSIAEDSAELIAYIDGQARATRLVDILGGSL